MRKVKGNSALIRQVVTQMDATFCRLVSYNLLQWGLASARGYKNRVRIAESADGTLYLFSGALTVEGAVTVVVSH